MKKKLTPIVLSGILALGTGSPYLSVLALENSLSEQTEDSKSDDVEKKESDTSIIEDNVDSEIISPEEAETTNLITEDLQTTTEAKEAKLEAYNNSKTIKEIDISDSNSTVIAASGTYRIIGQSTTSDLRIAENVIANLEFDNVQMLSKSGNLTISSGAKVYITLKGNNIIQADQDGAGNAVNMADNAELHFTANSTGSIILHGGSNYHGGSDAVKGGNLYIEGGTVTMIGGNKIKNDYGASYNVKSITITGGTVNCYQGTIDSTIPGTGSPLLDSPSPTFNVKRTKDSLTVNLTNYNQAYGGVEYRINNESWTSSNIFTNLENGTEYKISVRYTGSGYYNSSETSQNIRTLLDGNDLIKEPTNLTATYGQQLSDVVLPEGWTWSDPQLVLNENIQDFALWENYFDAYYDVRNLVDKYDFSGVNGYNPTTNQIKRTFKVVVSQAPSSIEFVDGFKLGKVYDGEPVSVTKDDVITSGSTGAVTFKYQERMVNSLGTESWKDLSEAPTSAGTYKVQAILDDDDWHADASIYEVFTIRKAEATVDFLQTNIDKEYDGKPAFVGTQQTGSSNSARKTWYKLGEDGTWIKLEEAPTNAGRYKVVATVEGNRNYNGATKEMRFTISKAVPEYTIPNDLSGTQGQTLSEIQLPEGFSWMEPSTKLEQSGKHIYKALYKPTDTVNYETVSDISISVTVNPKQAATSGGSTDANRSSKKNNGTKTSSAIGSIGASVATMAISGIGILGLLKKKNKK